MVKLNISSVDPNPYGITAEDVDQAFDEIRTNDKGENEELEGAEKTAEEYAQMKGPNVTIPRRNSPPVPGKLVDWKDPANYRVVWFDGFTYLFKSISANELKKLNPFLEGSLAKMQASDQARTRLTSLFEDAIVRPIRGREINNGGQAETLEEALHTFELPGGIEGVAATSKAGYKYETEKDAEGNEVPKDRNEDMWLVDTETGLVGIFDGMGGGKKGTKVAEIAATTIASQQKDIPTAALKIRSILAADPEIRSKDGVCFLTVRPVLHSPLEINQCGDVDVYHFGAKGKVKYAPGQQMELGQEPQSLFEYLESLIKEGMPPEQVKAHLESLARAAKKNVDDNDREGLKRIFERIQAKHKPVVETNNAMYGAFRKMVVRGLNKSEAKVASFKTQENVEEGDWIISMSDGVSDNLIEGEIERHVAIAIKENWTPEQLAKKISRIVNERIKMAANDDSIAKKNHYKLDNATVIAMRVKGKSSEKAKTEVRAA